MPEEKSNEPKFKVIIEASKPGEPNPADWIDKQFQADAKINVELNTPTDNVLKHWIELQNNLIEAFGQISKELNLCAEKILKTFHESGMDKIIERILKDQEKQKYLMRKKRLNPKKFQ